MKKNRPSLTQLTTCISVLYMFNNEKCRDVHRFLVGYLKQEIEVQIHNTNLRIKGLRHKEERLQNLRSQYEE